MLLETDPNQIPETPSHVRNVEEENLGDLYAESGQTLQGSFSAVSKPNFASKYSLESSRWDLHNAFFCIFSLKIVEHFADFLKNILQI